MAINYLGTGLAVVTCGLETGMDLPDLASVIDTDTLGGEAGTYVTGSPPDAPASVSAAEGDTEVVLTIDAAAEEVVYARYRFYPGGNWTDEDEALKRTGDGDITITGLTNDTPYEFAVYAKEGNLTSNWLTVTGTPVDPDDETVPEDDLPEHAYPRVRGPWAVLWLTSNNSWAYESIQLIAQKLGRLR